MTRCLLPLLLLLLLAACTGETLRQPFGSYNRAYADTLNEQMLLNLARLHNGHPAYFLAVGAIDNKFTLIGGVSGGGNLSNTDLKNQSLVTTNTSTTTSGVLGAVGKTVANTVGATTTLLTGGNASANMSATSSPEFQLIPLNNDLVAKQFLEPISIDVFFTLYQQGLPIDQLLRVLVERIETTLPDEGRLVLFNSPTAGGEKSFARFLRMCAILRQLQHDGSLLFEETKREAKIIGTTGANWKMTGKDLLDAHDKKLVYRKKEDGTFDLIQEMTSPTFTIKQGTSATLKEKLYASGITADRKSIDHVVDLLSHGISVKIRSDDATPDSGGSRLILRSYARAMDAAATEQDGFSELMVRKSFTDIVPPTEQRPVLRTLWQGSTGKLRPALQEVHYQGQTYQVTDPVVSSLDPAVRWNRDVFRLLVELGAQVSVDIAKFQRQVLELR